MSISARIEPFFTDQGEQDRAAGTVANIRYNLTHIFVYREANSGVAVLAVNVTPLDIRQYREWLKEKKYKPATINHRLSDLRIFLRWSVSISSDSASLASPSRPGAFRRGASRNATSEAVLAPSSRPTI